MISTRTLLLSIALLAPNVSADVVWTGAVSSDIFDEANWDLTTSTVTAIDPNVAIDDDVVIADAPGPVRLLALGGGYEQFRVAEGRVMTIDNSFVRAFGDEGFASDPGTFTGIDLRVINGGTLRTYFVVNSVRLDVDGSSSLIFGDPDTPVNGSTIDISIGTSLAFLRETAMEFTNEHLSKLTIDGAPAMIGFNVDVIDDGAGGCTVEAIRQPIGSNYCTAEINSTMQRAEMAGLGSPNVSSNDVLLECAQLPNFVFGFFIVSRTQGFVMGPAGSDGNLCLGGSIGRYVGPGEIQNSGNDGRIELQIDLTAVPQPLGFESVLAGQRWNFQCWFRDAGLSGTGTSNFSDGLSVQFI